MATQNAVNAGSRFCRDCGGPVAVRDEFVWCENTTTQGTQKAGKDVCRNLTAQTRLFCEHCGACIKGPVACGVCDRPATRP